MNSTLVAEIKRTGRDLGFSAVGIAPARVLPAHQRAFRRYLAEGRHAGMTYLAREPERREDPTRLLPGAQTVIALAAPYYQGDHGAAPDEPAGRIARYAWGADYHDVIEERVERLARFIRESAPDCQVRVAVDHAPLLERAYAQEAGLGFIGKNALLITPGHGSWVLLAELVTTLDLPVDEPGINQCGSCTRCLEACPTLALTAPFQLDAARCLSYLTIEHKGPMPEEYAAAAGDWLFGCDACQEACPYNAASPTAPYEGLEREHGPGPWLGLADASASRSLSEFDRRFQGTALRRAGKNGLRRNADAIGHRKETVPGGG